MVSAEVHQLCSPEKKTGKKISDIDYIVVATDDGALRIPVQAHLKLQNLN